MVKLLRLRILSYRLEKLGLLVGMDNQDEGFDRAAIDRRRAILEKYHIKEPDEKVIEYALGSYRSTITTLDALNKRVDKVIQFLGLPSKVEDLDIPPAYVEQHLLKIVYVRGPIKQSDITNHAGVIIRIISDIMSTLQDRGLVEFRRGSGGVSYSVTSRGAEEARRVLEQDPYLGPLPVSYRSYWTVTTLLLQGRTPLNIPRYVVEEVFGDVIGCEHAKKKLLDAATVGQGAVVYGPPGTGKTFICSKAAGLLPSMLIPKYVLYGGKVVQLYDPDFHKLAPPKEQPKDKRWVKIEAPFVFTGPELTLRVLNGEYDPTEGVYKAPPQVKANGGVLLIDDIGRQIDPHHTLLDRLIVPMENRKDILYIGSIPVEFHTHFLPLFATNLSIGVLDEAHLRRAPIHIYLGHPPVSHVAEVFKRCLEEMGERFEDGALEAFVSIYGDRRVKPSFAHARDVARMCQAIRINSGDSVVTAEMVFKAMERHVVVALQSLGVDTSQLGGNTTQKVFSVKIFLVGEMSNEELAERLEGLDQVHRAFPIYNGLIVDIDENITLAELCAAIKALDKSVRIHEVSVVQEYMRPLVDGEKLQRLRIKSGGEILGGRGD